MSFDLAAVQAAIRDYGLDGWLFQDFRGSDPLSYSILGIDARQHCTRRWFYYVPAAGEPTKIVHAIESAALDSLPGGKRVYLRWQELSRNLQDTLRGGPRVAMQYSPNNHIPYVSRVDAGTVELVRSLGAEVVTSADLVQVFEATLTPEQYASHIEAADGVAALCLEAFDEIGRSLRAGRAPSEFEVQQRLMRRFDDLDLTTDHPPIAAAGRHSADPHYSPSAKDATLLAPGQTVLIDLWAKRRTPGAVYADITRVAVVGGEVEEEYLRVFEVVCEARDAAVEAVREARRAGRPMRGCDLDDVCRSVVERAGYGERFVHRTGHSIHETPHGNGANIDNLETRDERSLVPRTLFSIEPGIYLPGRFGVRSEVNVYLSESDAIVTGPAPQREIYRIDV
jgi:Xaa-Pro aminopeptidase